MDNDSDVIYTRFDVSNIVSSDKNTTSESEKNLDKDKQVTMDKKN